MTKNQRIKLMSVFWRDACASRGWNPADREKRLDVIGDILGRRIESTNEIGEGDEFTLVKNRLLMLADNLQGAMEGRTPTSHTEANRTRQMRHVIGNLVKCIALYHPNAEAYVAEIIRDKFRGSSRAMPLAIADLAGEQLRQLLMTLNGRLNNARTGLRARAGDSIHDMVRAARAKGADMKCACRQCVSGAQCQISSEPAVTASDPF